MKVRTHIAIGVVFLFAVLPQIAQGQGNNYVVSGIVVDNQNNPLFYANVGLLSAADSTFRSGVSTDGQGKFTLTNIKSGDYIFVVSYIGYEKHQQPLSVSGMDTKIAVDTVRLLPASTTLQSVSVYGKKPVYAADGEKILYNVSEDPSIQTGTVADALQNAPGVEVDIEGNVTLRGVSSVEIWINDRPSKLEAENLKTYLQQLPANSLERIEVINNPSARYTSTGTGGIINIVTKSNIKKNTFFSFGLNGTSRGMACPWISYMFANEKFSINIYTYGYYWHNKGENHSNSIILNENGDTSSYRNGGSQYKGDGISAGLFVNGSYSFDTMNIIYFGAGFNDMPFNKNSILSEYQYREYIYNPGIYDYTAENQTNSSYLWAYIWSWYEHKFNNKGHKISCNIQGNYSKFSDNNPNNRLYFNYPELNKDKIYRQNSGSNYISATIDYTLPYSEKGEIGIGVNGDFLNESVYKRIDTLMPLLSEYVLDSMRFENSDVKRSDMEGYITVQQKIGLFTLKGGLRFQNRYYNYIVINQPEHHGIKNFMGLYPSLHLSYASKSMHNITLSYTRRVSYPSASQSMTFIAYGEDDYSTGNKNIRSTYTNSIEAGWTKYFTKFGSVGLSAYFKNSKDEISDLTDVIYSDFFGHYVDFTMPVNSGKSHRYGADANVMYKLKSFMNIRLNASVYQSHSETVFRQNTTVMTDDFTYSLNLNFWAKLWKILEVNASGSYRSKTKSLFLVQEPVYAINCGLRCDFWKQKISVFLNAQDIFNWNKQKNNITNPYYTAYNSNSYISRYIAVGITFRFGKIEMEQQARTGGKME